MRDNEGQRRLNGLLEKRKFEQERQKLISDSLRNGQAQNKKIVFKDSDDVRFKLLYIFCLDIFSLGIFIVGIRSCYL